MKPLRLHAVQAPLSPAQRLVLAELLDHADATGHAWPSVATLATRTGCHKDTVRRALARLQAEGLILRAGSAPARQGSPVARWLVSLPGRVATSDPSPPMEGSQRATLSLVEGSQRATLSAPEGSQDATLGVSKGRNERPEVEPLTPTPPVGTTAERVTCNCCGNKYPRGEEHANQHNIGHTCVWNPQTRRWTTRTRYQRRAGSR